LTIFLKKLKLFSRKNYLKLKNKQNG